MIEIQTPDIGFTTVSASHIEQVFADELSNGLTTTFIALGPAFLMIGWMP